jgi:uncharacterized protein YehS (DUF1456 family)
MTNNYFIRRTQYIFSLKAKKMIEIFKSVGVDVTFEQVVGWTRRDEDPEVVLMEDSVLAAFLNGFIIEKRGKKDGPAPVAEEKLNNNIILRKFRIALDMKDTDMLEIFRLSHTQISKHELSSFFRKKDHRNWAYCKDQFLRNFFHGLQAKFKEGISYDDE